MVILLMIAGVLLFLLGPSSAPCATLFCSSVSLLSGRASFLALSYQFPRFHSGPEYPRVCLVLENSVFWP